jgi:RNA polymerase sigma-70 factor (ECF subfamily)
MSSSGPPPEPDDDLLDSLDLVRHAQAGELAAYGELFARYYPRVRALVRQRIDQGMRKDIDSDDLLQEAMLDAIRGFERFEVRSRRELIGWFARIIENRMRSVGRHMHAQKRDRAKEVPLGYVADYLEQSNADFQPQADTPGPQQLATEREEVERLQECLDELEEDQRRVLLLRHRHNLSWGTIAQELGRPSADSARMQYTRARIALQKALRARGGGA